MKIAPDKLLHLFAGFIIATIFQFSLLFIVIAVIGIGLGKEIYDKNTGSTFDWYDFLYTVVGSITGYLVILIYK